MWNPNALISKILVYISLLTP